MRIWLLNLSDNKHDQRKKKINENICWNNQKPFTQGNKINENTIQNTCNMLSYHNKLSDTNQNKQYTYTENKIIKHLPCSLHKVIQKSVKSNEINVHFAND